MQPTISTPTKRKGHVTVVKKLYFTPPDSSAILTADVGYAYFCNSDEPPYGNSRTVQVGEEWQAIDAGWLKECGVSCLHIENLEGTFKDKQPTPEERKKALSRLIYVSVPFPEAVEERRDMHSPTKPKPIPPMPNFIVRPGRTLDAEPYDLSLVKLRCSEGVAKARIILLPA